MAQISSGKFTWTITDFSRRESERFIHFDVFTVGGCKWRMLVCPKGNDVDHFSMYLSVADSGDLPSGWSTDTTFKLTMVNQIDMNDSTTMSGHHDFTAQANSWGFKLFKRLTELCDSSKGYLVNNTLIVEAEVEVLNVVPPLSTRFDTFFINLDKFISDAEPNPPSKGGVSLSLNSGLKSKAPSLEEVEMAKQSLKECLSDLCKLNMKDRLATALETLTLAEIGLSLEQQQAIWSFWVEFDDFVSDFLTFEHDNSEFELNKLVSYQMFCSMKRNQETHVSNKQLLDDLTKEEEELAKRMEEVKSKKTQLISDWGTLITESEETKSKYKGQKKKLAEAEEKKRIAEERMSRSSAAWSSLKEHFV